MDPFSARMTSISISCLIAVMLIAGSFGSALAIRQTGDICASNYVPLIQNAGLDVKKSAPTLGCREDGNGNWWMPTAASLVDDYAYQQLDSHGNSLLDAIDRMSMDEAFTYSIRYDRANATAITIGSYNRVIETDISDAPMTDGPTWLHNWEDGYEKSLTTYLTRTMGDEDELVAYMYWFITRRDMTVSVLTSNMNPMLANAQRSNWGFQRAPWPWQLADPHAIQEYVSATAPPEAEPSQSSGENPTLTLNPAYIEARPGEIVNFTIEYPRLQGVTHAAFIAFAEDAIFTDLPLYRVDFSGGACSPGHEEYAVDPLETATELRPGEPFPLPVSLGVEVAESAIAGDLLNVCIQMIGFSGDTELLTWNATALIVVKE